MSACTPPSDTSPMRCSVVPASGGLANARAARGLLEEAAVVDRLADARQVLIDDAAGADVEVPDLGVAHLALGQADGRARRLRACRADTCPQRGRTPACRPGRRRCRARAARSPSRRAPPAPPAGRCGRRREAASGRTRPGAALAAAPSSSPLTRPPGSGRCGRTRRGRGWRRRPARRRCRAAAMSSSMFAALTLPP